MAVAAGAAANDRADRGVIVRPRADGHGGVAPVVARQSHVNGRRVRHC